MKYLILLTRKYPYLSGEPFLENEIKEIASYFDKVCIFPTDACERDKQTRSISLDNIDVFTVEKKKIKWRHYKYAFWGMLRAFMKGSCNWQQILDFHFQSMADSLSKHIIKCVHSHYLFKKEDEVVLYSYWLYVTAKIILNLRDDIQYNVKRVVCVSRAHRFDIYEEKRGHLPFQQQLVESLDKVFPCSENGTVYLKQRYPQCSDKIETAYLGTYDHGLNRGSEEGDTTFRIVSCSRMTEVKRVDLIIDALKILQRENLKVAWTHLGGGELFKHIKERVSRELTKLSIELTGAIKNEDVYRYYQSHHVDLFINVSASEGLPVSIMEAISFGIPVIATNVGGTSEIVLEGMNGNLLNEDFKIEQLAMLIKKYVLMDRQEREQLKLATRDLWKQKFQAVQNYNAFARNLLDI